MIATNAVKSVFIKQKSNDGWLNGTNVTRACCTFDQSVYDDRLFDSLGVEFPKTLGRAVIKRKAEFLAGRYCAKRALIRLGVEPLTIGVGKLRNPLWPKKVKGSISHSGQSAIAVTSLDADILGVGVDIEKCIEESMIEQVSSSVLQRCEKDFLQQRHMTATQLFTVIFSIKESFFKAAFPLVNAYFDFDAVTVVDLDTKTQMVQFELNYSLHEQLQKGMRLIGKYCLLKTLSSEYDSLASLVIISRR